MEINKIYNENCLDTMAKMPDNFIDLTVTSPPYDNLREYKGYSFAFEKIAKELYRVTKQGGVVVWVVGDATMNGSESGTSFKQALFFKEIGFNLHDTMIYAKQNPIPLTHNRYEQQFEYMFVFSKGKPKTFNGLKEKSKYGGEMASRTRSFYKTNTENEPTLQNKRDVISDEKLRNNIWYYIVGSTQTGKIKHPAIFPEQLANDHIISWSNENDLIYDPFMGSGTTAKMAILNNRKYIGSEISEEYCKIIETRIKECGGLFFNSFETELSNEAGTWQLAYNTELSEVLKSNHFTPQIEETIFMEGKQVTGLVVDCYSVILMADKVARIKEVLQENGVEGYRVDGLPNSMQITITKSKA